MIVTYPDYVLSPLKQSVCSAIPDFRTTIGYNRYLRVIYKNKVRATFYLVKEIINAT